MAITLGMITFDTTDPKPLAAWWAKQMAGKVEQENDGWFCVVSLPESPQKLAFQKVDNPTPGKNRVHLDLGSDDLDGEVARMTSDGATLVDQHEMNGFRWVTLADPAGNQFCIAGPEA
ncbi:glyoxalase [Rhodococcus sp. WMMA185]|uniref:VOC family protein n=1 Tax=Rhodococcus sp. WMMA185 TaxID=679318 RepID=UPI00087836A2|nr:VOC family protein [Rhodococcus sp. WMMA185]AOW93426.1 glyoxalase [Rhodococcus sp. WMMA185]